MKKSLNIISLAVLSIGLFAGCDGNMPKDDALKNLDLILTNCSEKYDDVKDYRTELATKNISYGEILEDNKAIMDLNFSNNLVYTYQYSLEMPDYEAYMKYDEGTYYEFYENSKQYKEYGVNEKSYERWDSVKYSSFVVLETLKTQTREVVLEIKDLLNDCLVVNYDYTYDFKYKKNGSFEYSISRKYDYYTVNEKYVIDDYLLTSYTNESLRGQDLDNPDREAPLRSTSTLNISYKSSIKSPKIKDYTLENQEFKGEKLDEKEEKWVIEDILSNKNSLPEGSFEVVSIENESNEVSTSVIRYVKEKNVLYMKNQNNTYNTENYYIYNDKEDKLYAYNSIKKEYSYIETDKSDFWSLVETSKESLSDLEDSKNTMLEYLDMYKLNYNASYDAYSNRPGHLGLEINFNDSDIAASKIKLYVDDYLMKYYEQEVDGFISTININYSPKIELPSFDDYTYVENESFNLKF